MSNLILKNLTKHIEVLEKKLEGDDVKVLGKELDGAKAFLSVTTDGRVRGSIERRIKVLEERMQNAQPDKSLTKIHDNLVLVVKMMSEHGNYAPRKRKTRTKKAK